MIALPSIAIRDKIYESSNSLVCRGIRDDGSEIVVKMLKQDYPSPQELTRYRQEYEITSSLNAEGVVKAFSQQNYQRTLVILLEDFGGESLEQWIRSHPETFCPMPLSTFLRLAIKLTDILGKIHAAHVIHKDINPGNIVLNLDTGVVKIIDFGIATQFNRTNPTLKSPHVLEGTLAYLSPEQTGRMNRSLDYRTDFYSLGVTFYELLTGHLPFPTTNMLELVHCHIAKQPVPSHEVNGAIPKPVSDIIVKLMAKNAEDRYQSAWGIKADLELCDRQLAEIGRIDRFQLALQDVCDRFQIPQKLYGREQEVALLLAAFVRVACPDDDRIVGSQNNSGTRFKVEMMLVSGYAGIGKSALVQELYKPITEKRGYFISGKFDQLQRNIPYSAIADALQKLVQQLLGEPDDRVEMWRSRLLSALGNNGQIIIDVIPEVELIIGKQLPVPEVGVTEAQNRFNLTFQRFVRAFCAKEHPLVIFLDDLQWIDSATLKLIELIFLLDEQIQYLFLIGAYRNNEVTPTHPLILTLESLRNQGAVLQEIILTPLTLEPLSQLIAETLHHNPDIVRALAQAVSRKTEGNPFFVGEFLKMLYGENLLTFDAQQLSWQWNLAEIEAQDITDNVVELLLHQLQKLPEATQQILSIAACTGAEFDLETLAIVCEKSPKAIFQDLLAAIQAGLIQPLSDLDEDLLVQEYKFSHDRVQQAAYALIDESQKQVIHLQIGRNLLEKTSLEQRSDRLFEIIDHLNQGLELVTARSERTEIAKFNLMAGQKAKAATAYEAAFQYFTSGLKLLNPESWQSEYDLTLALYSEAAEATYLQGRFDEMEQLVEVVLNRAKTVVDKVQAYDSRIQAYLSQGNLKEALKTGLEALKLLGIDLIENPSQADIQRELESTAALLAEREIEDLINLLEMTAPEPLAAMSILANIGAAAFIMSPALVILITCKTVNLSINYGNAIWSPLYYAAYGFVLCGVVQDIELGYKFGQFALSLAERLNTQKGKAKALQLFSDHVMQWKVHLKETIPLLVEAYQEGVETGDFETAGYAAYDVCYNSFFVGEELTQLEQKMATYSKAVDRIRRESPSTWIAIVWQTILNLLDRSENPSRLVGRVCNEEQALPHALAVKDGTAIQMLYLHKVILCYLFEEYHQAVQTAILARQHFEEVTAIKVLPVFSFYHSLALLSLSLDASNSEKSAWLNSVNTNQEKMQKWAEHAPMNYLHKFYLVEAEKARVLGQLLEAEKFYEQAIQGARENEYIQEEALAYELAAKHYLARGLEKFAQIYMKEACHCYDRWGAIAKVKDLENRYPQLLNSNLIRQSNSTLTDETIRRPTATIDLATVMKAAQALSEITHLDRLIAKLMQVAIENAGAETGTLILLEDDRLAVVAHCSGSRQSDLEKISVADCATIPVSVIQLVERTQESLVFDDAVSESSFSTDPYIQHQQTRSLLCMPILKQSQLVGILYLENNLSTGVFTSDRLQVLKLLMAQVAISLENARLYEQLVDYSETLERKVEERTQALQQEMAERQQTEAALQRSETKFRAIFENSQVGIFRSRLSDGLILNANQRFADLFGFDSPEEMIGLEHSIDYFVNPSDRQHAIELMKRDGEVRSYEVQLRKRDGTIFWGFCSSHLNAADEYVEGVIDDISDRKQAEEALQRSESKFRNIFENSQVGIYRTRTCDGLILNANQRFADLFGFDSPEEMIGLEHSIDYVVNPSDRLHAIELMKRDGEVRSYEAQMQKRDGTLFWGLCSCYLNAADRYVEGVIADISDRKRAEAALQTSEERLRLALTASNQGLYDLNIKTGEIVVNPEYALVLGYDPATFHVNKSKWIESLHPDDRESVVATYYACIIGEVPNFQVEYRRRTQDGQWKWILDVGKIVTWNEFGEPIRALGVITDIDDRKLAEATSILEERNRMAREIHDTLAQAFTGILAQVGAANQVLTDDLEATQAHLDLIKELARTGLTEARRSVVALRPQLLEEGSLQSALHHFVAQLRTAAMDTTLYDEIEGEVYALPTEVESNLLRMGQEALTNAIKHANADEIRVKLVYDRDQFCLRVKDNGQGFGVGSIPSSEGFGLLGMSERAERIGAKLTIRSQPGQGTEIIVTVNRE